MTALHDLSAVELLKRYRAKTLSPSEVFADVEAKILVLVRHYLFLAQLNGLYDQF